MPLDNREHRVLATIVEDYIANAKPVGSRTVARLSGLSLSAASMRNTMADLTDQGYLAQPHASAGRIPTTKAFRHYLDTVLRVPALGEDDRRAIQSRLGRSGLEVTDVLRQASRLLSSFSRQVSMVLSPATGEAKLKRIDFVPVGHGLVLAVMVLEGGLTQNRLVAVKDDPAPDDLIKFGNYLNHHYSGLGLGEIRLNVVNELRGARRHLSRLYHRALALARDAFAAEDERDFFYDGAATIMDQPEFSDISAMRDLLSLLEERTRLLELLDKTIRSGRMNVSLGPDPGDGLADYGLIASPYGGGSAARGVVGVIGPLRMDYAKVMPVVDYTARMLTEMLKGRA